MSLEALYARRSFGIKPGLDTVRRLLDALGHPESGLLPVHVAGTNGKGSTCAMIARGLETLRVPVGLTTSPHLVRFNERFQINGENISDEELDRHLARVEAAARVVERDTGIAPTFFECAICIAFLHFQEHGVRLCVVETGMGGRLDATNVLAPVLTVVTRVALDHTQFLGPTIQAIAGEKAGILKKGVPAVVGAMPDEAFAVLAETARRVGAPLVDVREAASVRRVSGDLLSQKVKVSTPSEEYGTMPTPLIAAYQTENIANAVAALETLRDTVGLPLPPDAVKTAVTSARWPGRLQCVRRDGPLTLVDGAHNPDGAAALAASLRAANVPKRGVVAVCGFCADKDVEGFYRVMGPYFEHVFCTPFSNPRALAPADSAALAARYRVPATPCADLAEALAQGKARALETGLPLLVCGSLYLIGEVLPAFPG